MSVRQWNGMALTERKRPLDWRTLAYDFAHFEVTGPDGEWTLACTTSETASARLSDMPAGSAKWGVTATGERVRLKYNVRVW